jgi:hypothetical protein
MEWPRCHRQLACFQVSLEEHHIVASAVQIFSVLFFQSAYGYPAASASRTRHPPLFSTQAKTSQDMTIHSPVSCQTQRSALLALAIGHDLRGASRSWLQFGLSSVLCKGARRSLETWRKHEYFNKACGRRSSIPGERPQRVGSSFLCRETFKIVVPIGPFTSVHHLARVV